MPTPTPAGGIRVANDVDRAAVRQQVVELRLIRELVDPFEIDQKQPARGFGRHLDAIEKHLLLPMVGANPHEVALASNEVDQLELLEERRDRLETLAHLRPGFDRDAERGASSKRKLTKVCPTGPAVKNDT